MILSAVHLPAPRFSEELLTAPLPTGTPKMGTFGTISTKERAREFQHQATPLLVAKPSPIGCSTVGGGLFVAEDHPELDGQNHRCYRSASAANSRSWQFHRKEWHTKNANRAMRAALQRTQGL